MTISNAWQPLGDPLKSLKNNVAEPASLAASTKVDAAWQRAMERAQFGNWFKPFVAGRGESNSTADTATGVGTARQRLIGSSTLFPAAALFREPVDSDERSVAVKVDSFQVELIQRDHASIAGTQEAHYLPVEDFLSPTQAGDQRQAMVVGGSEPMATWASIFGAKNTVSTPLERTDFSAAPFSQTETVRSANTVDMTAIAARLTSALGVPVMQLTALELTPVRMGSQLAVVSLSAALFTASQVQANFAVSPYAANRGHPEVPEAELAMVGEGLTGQTQESDHNIRLHVQWHDGTARVWLGMNGSAEQVSDRLKLILPELLGHFADLGVGIEHIVCNGAVVFDGRSFNGHPQKVNFARHFEMQQRMRAETRQNRVVSFRHF